MNKIIRLLLLSACISLFCISCNQGPKPVEIEGLDTFTDAATKFSIQYPKNWLKSEVIGTRFVAFSHNDVKNRFTSRATEGFPGAKIDLIVTTLDSSRTLDSVVAKSMILPPKYYEIADVTIDGVQGKKIAYSYPLEGGMFNGLMYIATKDGSKATTLQIEAFDGTYEKYKADFETIIKSLKLAITPEKTKRDTTILVEAEPTSMNLASRQGDGFTLGIPDNFKAENIGKAGGAMKGWSFLGDRRGDCFIKIDMFDASKSKNLKKITDENQAKFPGSGTAQKTTLSGAEAYKIDYKPAGQVKGRVWFVIKNDRLYRVTINWFVGEEDKFLPAFEKSVASFKFQ
jgi:hypothetical protein